MSCRILGGFNPSQAEASVDRPEIETSSPNPEAARSLPKLRPRPAAGRQRRPIKGPSWCSPPVVIRAAEENVEGHAVPHLRGGPFYSSIESHDSWGHKLGKTPWAGDRMTVMQGRLLQSCRRQAYTGWGSAAPR